MRADQSCSDKSPGAQPILRAARVGVLVIIAGLGQVHAAQGDQDCKGASDDCVAVGRWNISVALGAGVRTNPLLHGEDIPLVLVPQISYYGKRFFLDNLDFGFTLAERGASTFNLIATPGYDRVFFYRSDLQNFFIGFPTSPRQARPSSATTHPEPPEFKPHRRALPIWPAPNGPSSMVHCRVNSICFATRPARIVAMRYARPSGYRCSSPRER